MPKVLWENEDVKNFPCFCRSWEDFELELEGRQFFFRCILVPDTQPYTVDRENGNIVLSKNPRSTKILDPDLRIRRYKCEHSAWPTSDSLSSDKTGCPFFLIAIQPFFDKDDVFVQIGYSKSPSGGFLTRNHDSQHNHLAKALWMRKSSQL